MSLDNDGMHVIIYVPEFKKNRLFLKIHDKVK